ncbi:Outer membrane protein assembly factor BamA [bacterium HR19]|nr:Outer membrane protein assembly factor BamA [bacterium HR19]
MRRKKTEPKNPPTKTIIFIAFISFLIVNPIRTYGTENCSIRLIINEKYSFECPQNSKDQKNEKKDDYIENLNFARKICSLLEDCPSIYETQNIFKALLKSGVIYDFKISPDENNIQIKLEKREFIKKVAIKNEIQDKKLAEEINTELKRNFENRFFQENLPQICENILRKYGIKNPTCETKIKKEILYLKIKGEIEKIKDVILNIQDEKIKEEIEKLAEDIVGEVASEYKINETEKKLKLKLNRLGFFKAQIKLTYNKEQKLEISISPGKIHVIFLWIEKAEKIGIDTGEIKKKILQIPNISEVSVKNLIYDELKKEGIPVKKIKYEETELEDLAIVSINVELEKLYYLSEFSIVGLKKLNENEIKRKIGVDTTGIINLFYPRYALYSEDKIESFIKSIIEYARSKGFENFKIEKIENRIEKDKMYVKVFVDEGERTVITSFETINFPENVSHLIPKTPIFYDYNLIREVKEKLENYISEKGYMKFTIAVSEIRENPRLKKIVFTYVGDETKSKLSKIFIESKTSDEYIRKISAIKEGEILSSKKIKDAEDEINKTQYFSKANIVFSKFGEENENSSIKNESKDEKNFSEKFSHSANNKYIGVLYLKEGELNELNISGGISSTEGVRSELQFVRKNMFSGGVDLRAGAKVAYWIFPVGREYGLTFLGARSEVTRRKLIYNTDFSFLISPYYISTFLYTVQKPLSTSVIFSYSEGNIKIYSPFSFELRSLKSWVFDLKPETLNLNNIFLLSPSFHFVKSFSPNHRTLFSIKTDTIKPVSESLSERIEGIFEYYNIKKFWGIGLISSAGLLLYSSIFTVPIEKRFFLGGIAGPRGYQEISIYPKYIYTIEGIEDSRKSEKKFIIMTELYLPQILIARPYFFFDMGDVFHDFSKVKLYKGIGPGILAETLFGTFRLELGYGIERRTFLIHFSVGFFRNIM